MLYICIPSSADNQHKMCLSPKLINKFIKSIIIHTHHWFINTCILWSWLWTSRVSKFCCISCNKYIHYMLININWLSFIIISTTNHQYLSLIKYVIRGRSYFTLYFLSLYICRELLSDVKNKYIYMYVGRKWSVWKMWKQ